MWVAAKNQLVIESAAPYCSKLTTQKLRNTAMKKKKKYTNAINLNKICCYFPSNNEHKLLFTNNAIHRKKLPSQTDNKNHDKNR